MDLQIVPAETGAEGGTAAKEGGTRMNRHNVRREQSWAVAFKFYLPGVGVI